MNGLHGYLIVKAWLKKNFNKRHKSMEDNIRITPTNHDSRFYGFIAVLRFHRLCICFFENKQLSFQTSS